MKPSILIAEKEFGSALELQKTLLSLGYKAEKIVSNGDDALRLAKKINPDLILMDTLFAEEKDALEAIKIINTEMNIPIIYMTSDNGVLDTSTLPQPFAYITKPYNEKDLIGVIETAMARVAVRQLLEASESKFRRIFESVADQVLVLDADGKIVEANSQNFIELGFQFEEIRNFSLDHICHLRKAYLKSILKKSVQSNSPVLHIGKMTRKDGTKFSCEIRFSMFKNGKDQQFLAVARNISGRIQARKEHQSMIMQLAHMGKLAMLGTMSASLMHELKNPLTSIVGLSEILLHKKEIPDALTSKFLIIQKAAMQMKHTIDHLNVYTRQDSVEDMQNINLQKTIENALEMMKGQIGDTTIHINHAEDVGEIWANFSQIEGVLQNLIINSIDSFHDRDILEKNITIKTYETDGRICIDYEDNAGGMTKEVLPKVFQPFFTTKKAGKGTGLGLSIIQSVMEHHKGLIYLTVKESKGTRFVLSFPKAAKFPETEFDSHKMVACKIIKAGKPHILLIDDDPQFTSVLEYVLGDRFDVISFNDPEQAMLQLKNDDIDLIVTDLDMPKVTGEDIIRYANTLEKRIPIIVITGTSVNQKSNPFNTVDAVVEKPISEYDTLINFILENLD